MAALSGKNSRADCPLESSNDQWEQVIVRFSLTSGVETPLPFTQPVQRTTLLEAKADGGDPGIAVVTLHSIVRIRNLIAAAPPTTNWQQPDLSPPIAHAATAVPPAPDEFQRGGLPQYCVTFQDGSDQGARIYCDGNSKLALPARFVLVELVTPQLIQPTAIPGGELEIGPGLIVEAQAGAHVAFSLKSGLVNSGPLTWSQSAQSLATENILFERPPFAKRVVVIPPSTVGAVVRHLCSPTLVIATPPPSSNQDQVSQDLAANVTHVRVDLQDQPAGHNVHCIWELSV